MAEVIQTSYLPYPLLFCCLNRFITCKSSKIFINIFLGDAFSSKNQNCRIKKVSSVKLQSVILSPISLPYFGLFSLVALFIMKVLLLIIFVKITFILLFSNEIFCFSSASTLSVLFLYLFNLFLVFPFVFVFCSFF